MRLIDGWRQEINRLWSARLAVAQAAIGAAATAWVFYDPSRKLTIALALIMFLFGVAIAVARIVKQKGGQDGDGN